MKYLASKFVLILVALTAAFVAVYFIFLTPDAKIKQEPIRVNLASTPYVVECDDQAERAKVTGVLEELMQHPEVDALFRNLSTDVGTIKIECSEEDPTYEGNQFAWSSNKKTIAFRVGLSREKLMWGLLFEAINASNTKRFLDLEQTYSSRGLLDAEEYATLNERIEYDSELLHHRLCQKGIGEYGWPPSMDYYAKLPESFAGKVAIIGQDTKYGKALELHYQWYLENWTHRFKEAYDERQYALAQQGLVERKKYYYAKLVKSKWTVRLASDGGELKDGLLFSLHENGVRAEEGVYKDGKKIGRWYHWDKKGNELKS